MEVYILNQLITYFWKRLRALYLILSTNQIDSVSASVQSKQILTRYCKLLYYLIIKKTNLL